MAVEEEDPGETLRRSLKAKHMKRKKKVRTAKIFKTDTFFFNIENINECVICILNNYSFWMTFLVIMASVFSCLRKTCWSLLQMKRKKRQQCRRRVEMVNSVMIFHQCGHLEVRDVFKQQKIFHSFSSIKF